MTNSDAPWHHWPVAALALAFYTFEVLDSALTKLGISAYTNMFPPEMATLVAGLPVWVAGLWSIGCWAGLAGAFLLWKRNRYAVLLLLVGAVATGMVTLWMSLISSPTIFGVAGVTGFYLLIGASAISFLIYLYARWERTQSKLA